MAWWCKDKITSDTYESVLPPLCHHFGQSDVFARGRMRKHIELSINSRGECQLDYDECEKGETDGTRGKFE